jgi:hypothetical protein
MRRKRSVVWAPVVAGLAVGTLVAGGVPSAVAARSNDLTVTATEYSYRLKGHLHPGWADIRFVNHGSEPHMMAVIRLKPDVTLDQVNQALMSDDQSAAAAVVDAPQDETYGTPALLDAGHATEVVTNNLRAGHYAVVCFVPAPDGRPHFAHGMVRLFDVSGKRIDAKAPHSNRTVRLTDGNIKGVGRSVGQHATLKITNTGNAPHSFSIAHLRKGKTAEDAVAYFGAEFSDQPVKGPAPGVLVGGVDSMQPGQTAFVRLDLEPGRYAYASTAGDEESGQNDAARGMFREFRVH